MLIMVYYLKKNCGINQAGVTWTDLHWHTSTLTSFREWSVVSMPRSSDLSSRLDLLNIFPETQKFSGVFPGQCLRAGRAAAILENLLKDPT